MKVISNIDSLEAKGSSCIQLDPFVSKTTVYVFRGTRA